MNVSFGGVGSRRRAPTIVINTWRLLGWASVVVSVVAMVMIIAIFSTANPDAVAADADALTESAPSFIPSAPTPLH